jgi:hypothetical protein
MIEKIKQVPGPLQKQILIRYGIGVVFFLLFVLILIFYRDLNLSIPCVAFSVFFLVNAVLLMYRSFDGKYVIVEGVCSELEKTGLRKRIKAIYVDAGPHNVKVMIKQRLKRIAVGDDITVYLSAAAQVYEQDQCFLVYSYLALDVKSRTMNRAQTTPPPGSERKS